MLGPWVRARVTAWAGVDPGETGPVGWMVAQSLVLGLATVYFETAAFALFLDVLGARRLPAMYVTSAALCLALGALLRRIESRRSFGALMRAIVGLLVVSTVLWTAGLAQGRHATLIFLVCTWYGAVSMLTDFGYWAVAARLFDVRQAKRLFGVIGAGEPVARIAGAFSIPILLGWLAVEHLFWLSLVGLGAAALVQERLLRVLGPRARGTGAGAEGSSGPKARPALRGRYVRTILWIAAFSLLGKYLVDFAFYEQSRERYADAAALAGFFGIFGGMTQAASLLARVFLSGRALRRWGVAGALVVLPASQLACAAGAVVAAGLGMSAAVFWLTLSTQALYKVLKHPIDLTAFKVLFQPLAPSLRLAAQTLVDGILTPAVVGLAGILMWLAGTSGSTSMQGLAALMILVFAAWIGMVRRAGREYAGTVLEALRGGVVKGTTLDVRDEHHRAVLRRLIHSGSSTQALAALDILERHIPEAADEALRRLLMHPAPTVRRAALQRAEARQLEIAPSRLREVIARESDPDALAAGLRCLATQEGPRAAERIRTFLEHADPTVRRGALVALLLVDDEAATERLRAMASSERIHERQEAASTIGEGGLHAQVALLVPLLAHSSPDVRRSAVEAAGRLRSVALVPALVAAVSDREVRRKAMGALVATGGASVEPVAEALEWAVDGKTRARLVRVLGRLRSQEGCEALLPRLARVDVGDRQATLDALRHAECRVTGPSTKWLRAALSRELALVDRCRGGVAFAPTMPAGLVDLAQALRGEVEAARERILTLVALEHGHDRAADLRRGLMRRDGGRRALALEALEVLADADVRNAVVQAFEDDAGASDPAAGPDQLVSLARGVATQRDGPLAPWAVAMALVALAEQGVTSEMERDLEGVGDAESPLIRAALKRLSAARRGPEDREKTAMDIIERVIYLKGVPMFAGASEHVLADVAQSLQEVTFAEGTVVFQEGDAGDSLFVVVSGRVRVQAQGRTLAELGPHAVFGEMALIESEPRLATMTTLAPTLLLRLERGTFEELMEDHIEIVRGTLRMLSERLRRAGGAAARRDDAGTGST